MCLGASVSIRPRSASIVSASRHSAGVRIDLVPVSSLDALARAKPSGGGVREAFGDSGSSSAYVYTRISDSGTRFSRADVRLGMGVHRGSGDRFGRRCICGALMQCEPLGDGEHDIVIEQGVEMGRPSVIDLQMVIKDGELVSAEIGGNAVMISRGELL